MIEIIKIIERLQLIVPSRARLAAVRNSLIANHVWATDITYIPMARGFVYLAAVMDWFARAR